MGRVYDVPHALRNMAMQGLDISERTTTVTRDDNDNNMNDDAVENLKSLCIRTLCLREDGSIQI
jgi:hypothetical protein